MEKGYLNSSTFFCLIASSFSLLNNKIIKMFYKASIKSTNHLLMNNSIGIHGYMHMHASCMHTHRSHLYIHRSVETGLSVYLNQMDRFSSGSCGSLGLIIGNLIK